MSSKGIIIFLIVASLIGLSFIFIRKISQAACPSGDQRICAFENNNKMMSSKSMKGTYEELATDGGKNIKANWEKSGEMNRVVVFINEKELVDVITSKRYFFLEDYADKTWWRQERSRVENSIETLPFSPDMYFTKLEDIFESDQTTYKFIQEASCGNTMCYRYQVLYPEQKEDEQMFIFFEKEGALLNSIFLANEDGTAELKTSFVEVNITEPEKIKIASDGKNLFLEYLDKKDKPTQKNYEYLKEFEEQRKQAELNATTNLEYVEETPTPTPTL